MKLYIKANNLKILKNLETLLPTNLSATSLLIDTKSHTAYKENISSAKELLKHQEQLFYDSRSLDKLIKGIYFGNSSCEHLLPPIKDIVEAQKICEAKHYNFVFMFAPLSQNYMQDARYICKHLAQKINTEVVVNDFGTLQLILEFKNLKPILGLNFTKIIKNAFVDNVAQIDISKEQFQNQKELLRHCEFENRETREFYKSLGCGRFGVENVNLDLSFVSQQPKMQVDYYYPHITISHSKACDIAAAFEDKAGYFVQESCAKYCQSVSLEFSHSDTLGLHQRYNTIYKTDILLDIAREVYKNDRNRLVWELFV